MNKKISVIIPLYNSEKSIVRTLDSVVNQTVKNIEIILVDDCSSDNSLNIARDFLLNKNIEFKCFENINNSGPSFSRNRGIDEADGEYIIFLDSDDLIVPFYAEHLLKAVEGNGYDFAFSNVYECDESIDLTDFDNSFEISEYKFDYRFSLVKRFGYSCGAIFRNSILKEHNIRFYEDCSYMEDNLFNNEYFKYINNACYVSSATYCYIMYTGSLSHSKDKMTIINNTKNTADLFETKIDLNNLLNDKRECSEFLKFRRYFINSIFGDSINSEYGIEAASQKYVYLRREYIKLIKNSDLSISTKIFELFMQSKNIEKSVYKMLIKKKKIDWWYKVSIIVPVYNAEKTLPKCIESILNQTYSNIEIILINDGSTDNSLSVCEKYAKKYNNIIVVDIKNEGVSAARNYGISVSNGDYIMFADSDDWLPKRSVEILMIAIVKNEADYSCGRVSNVTVLSNTEPFKEIENYIVKSKNAEDWYYFLRQSDWGPWGKIFNASLIKSNGLGFPLGIKSGEDSIFLAKYFSLCNTACIVNENVYYYNRLNENTALKKYYDDFNKWMLEYCNELLKLFAINNEPEDNGIEKYFSYFVIDVFDNVCKNYIKCNDKTEAVSKLEESYSLFSEYVNADMQLPEDAKKAQNKKEFYNEFFEDNDYENLYKKLMMSRNDGGTASRIKSILKRIKLAFVIKNKKYLLS